MKGLVDHYAGTAVLGADLATLHENLGEFSVAELRGTLVGCGALHVLRPELGEIRTVAVDPQHRGAGIGRALLDLLLQRARGRGLRWLFALTFETRFFGRHGFQSVRETPLPADGATEPAHSEGVAQYLDLTRVKPNTLGNTRMLLELDAA
ncbi:amino-acid N-acetyltransferase [Salinifilum aidingensis]